MSKPYLIRAYIIILLVVLCFIGGFVSAYLSDSAFVPIFFIILWMSTFVFIFSCWFLVAAYAGVISLAGYIAILLLYPFFELSQGTPLPTALFRTGIVGGAGIAIFLMEGGLLAIITTGIFLWWYRRRKRRRAQHWRSITS